MTTSIQGLLNMVIGKTPVNYITDINGNAVAVIDYEYILCGIVFLLMSFAIYYMGIQILRIISGGYKK